MFLILVLIVNFVAAVLLLVSGLVTLVG